MVLRPAVSVRLVLHFLAVVAARPSEDIAERAPCNAKLILPTSDQATFLPALPTLDTRHRTFLLQTLNSTGSCVSTLQSTCRSR